MTLKIISGEENAPLQPLLGKTVAVLGCGNQGAAHAMNLRDCGVEVIVANRTDSPNGRRAAASGFRPMTVEQATSSADLVIIALPDEVQPNIWDKHIAPSLRPGTIVGFLHGFCIHYGLIEPAPEVGVIMVAPKGPGQALRQRFLDGKGLPCLFALHQDPAENAEAIGLAWAAGIGCARAAIVSTTFAHETETDLFGEQAVLCGGITELIDFGYPPELAYMECCQEVKQIADLIHQRGLSQTMRAISNTAEFGAYRTGPRLIDEAVRNRMRDVLAEVRDCRFAQALRGDYADGFPWFSKRRQAISSHPIEDAGASVRAWTPWLVHEEDVRK